MQTKQTESSEKTMNYCSPIYHPTRAFDSSLRTGCLEKICLYYILFIGFSVSKKLRYREYFETK